jgi:hypothetical protein
MDFYYGTVRWLLSFALVALGISSLVVPVVVVLPLLLVVGFGHGTLGSVVFVVSKLGSVGPLVPPFTFARLSSFAILNFSSVNFFDFMNKEFLVIVEFIPSQIKDFEHPNSINNRTR